MTEIPIVMTKAGRVNTPPAVLRQQLVDGVAAIVPGYTSDLPGSLIEDVASTDTGALVTCDQAVTETINSLTPRGANLFLLNQIAQTAGILDQSPTNTSVYAVFSGPAGFVIAKGFTISDGTHQFIVQTGGIIASGGASSPLYCLASVPGTFAVPQDTVNQLITAIPATVTLTVNNPVDGIPSAGTLPESEYRARVLEAYSTSAMGMASFLRTLLQNVQGVQRRLISIQQGVGVWKILVGGGDPYEVAYEIYTALFDISNLAGSSDPDLNITVAINDFPDNYSVVFINPPAQTVSISLTWNTISPNFIAPAAVAQLGAAGLSAYVNSVVVGQPMNLFELQRVFQDAVANLLPTEFLTTMLFTVDIDGMPTPPDVDTGIIAGDPESYFTTDVSAIVISQG